MDAFCYGPINRAALLHRLERERPRNDERERGYALVFVQGPGSPQDRIPLSIQIAPGQVYVLERRFSQSKEIVLYGEDRASRAAESVASVLLNRGFVRLYVYEGGLRDWREGACPLESRHNEHQPAEQREQGRSGDGRRAEASASGRTAKSIVRRTNYKGQEFQPSAKS